MKTHSWPDNHWHWPIKLSHYHGVKRGGFIYTGGQASLDQNGSVVNPDDLPAQTHNVLQYVSAILDDLDSSLSDIVKLVIYFVGDHHDEAVILELIANALPATTLPAVSTICLSQLCYPAMRIELEAVAIDPLYKATNNPSYKRSADLPTLHQGYSHIVRCNNLLFTSDMSAVGGDGTVQFAGDLKKQTRAMMTQLEHALNLMDASMHDVLKLNVFYLGDGTAENWTKPAEIRAACFNDPGPAATGIAVTQFAQAGLMTKIAVSAMAPQSESTELKPRYSWPDGHWDWTSPLPYKHGNRYGNVIHLGGQVALDANAQVLHPGDVVAQTRVALENIKVILDDLGASMDDVIKVTTFYQGSASAESLHENLSIRSEAFETPGPATSGIPMPHLVYEDMVIEIEVIAIATD